MEYSEIIFRLDVARWTCLAVAAISGIYILIGIGIAIYNYGFEKGKEENENS